MVNWPSISDFDRGFVLLLHNNLCRILIGDLLRRRICRKNQWGRWCRRCGSCCSRRRSTRSWWLASTTPGKRRRFTSSIWARLLPRTPPLAATWRSSSTRISDSRYACAWIRRNIVAGFLIFRFSVFIIYLDRSIEFICKLGFHGEVRLV